MFLFKYIYYFELFSIFNEILDADFRITHCFGVFPLHENSRVRILLLARTLSGTAEIGELDIELKKTHPVFNRYKVIFILRDHGVQKRPLAL
jgi:hypothetical protein